MKYFPSKRPRFIPANAGAAPCCLQAHLGLFGGRCRSATAALVLLCASVASAVPVISTTTRAGTCTAAACTGSGADPGVTGRAPLPVVIDAGSGTTGGTVFDKAVCTEPGAVAIRIRESQISTVTYEDGAKTLIEADAFSLLSWEKLDLQNWDITQGWTASMDDALALWDNGTGVHGKPIAIKLNDDVIPEGTLGALTNEQWAWGCNAGDGGCGGGNVVYVQSAAVTPTIHAIYGDGTHIIIASGTGVTPGCFEVSNKDSDDQLTMTDAVCVGDPTDILIGEAVNAFTDLRYDWSVSCTGGVCVEDITNGDQRPGLSTTEIDETIGRGPIWAYVFAGDPDDAGPLTGFGVATITLTVTDDCNGGTDTQTITVTETAWTGGANDNYVDFTLGNDTTGDGTQALPWKTVEKALDVAQAETSDRRVFLKRGETFTVATSPATWTAETLDTLITSYGSGAQPIISAGASLNAWDVAGTSANIRMYGLTFDRPAGTRTFEANGNTSAYVNLLFTYSSTGNHNAIVERGVGGPACDDNVLWNCQWASTGANVDYALYDSGAATSNERMAVVGCKFDHDGNVSTHRSFAEKHNFTAYCDYVRDDIIDATNGIHRIYGGTGDTPYVYAYANYYHGVGNNEISLDIQEDGTGDIENVLIDSCYFKGVDSATAGNAIRFDAAAATDARIQNCVALGVLRFAEAFTSTAVEAARFFNNSAYTTRTGAKEFIGNSGTNSWRRLKVVNNAVHATSNNTSTLFVDGSGTFATLESTQITNNVWSMGTTNEMALIESVTYDAPADWTAATGKAAQVDLETSPIFALPASNDFRPCTASGLPDASCSGASPCIDAGYDLPTVYYDYLRAVRNSDDVGAWDDDSEGGMMNSGLVKGSFMLMGVGR